MRLWGLVVLVLMLAGTAAANPVDGGWHRSDEEPDPNATTIPQITTRTVTHYYPLSELSEAERTMLVTPTPAPTIPEVEQTTPVHPPNATFVWGVVAAAGLLGLVVLLWHRRQNDGN